MESEPASVSQMLQIITSLIFVVAVIFAGAWFFRRYGRFHGMINDEVRVIAGLSVGQREKVIILQAGDIQLMLGVSPGRIQTLHVFDKPVIDTNKNKIHDSENSGFASYFKKELKNKINQ